MISPDVPPLFVVKTFVNEALDQPALIDEVLQLIGWHLREPLLEPRVIVPDVCEDLGADRRSVPGRQA